MSLHIRNTEEALVLDVARQVWTGDLEVKLGGSPGSPAEVVEIFKRSALDVQRLFSVRHANAVDLTVKMLGVAK